MKRIIISRTDSIGDVILTLPMAGVLKELFPDNKIIFLGRNYTKPVSDLSDNIDEFSDWDEISSLPLHVQIAKFKALNADAIIHVFPKKNIADLAKFAKIPIRIGVINRPYHWFTCNYMIFNSRRNSSLHEAQLNLKLLHSFGIKNIFPLDDIPKYYGLHNPAPLNDNWKKLISPVRFNLILHPKSKGSSREWGLNNYLKLIDLLINEGIKIFITGSEEEGLEIRKYFPFDKYRNLSDLTGKMTLTELISFINACDGIIAGSTGPLHIAAALGKLSIGIFPPIRPMHPGRWAPIGYLSSFIVKNINCSKCRFSKHCSCLESISPLEVKQKLFSEM